MCIPDFLILGAAKCGTTTIADVLRECPGIYIPRIKEVEFFNSSEAYAKGLKFYKRYYPSKTYDLLKGDASPHYLYCSAAPGRIKQFYNQKPPKFIAILRNPYLRAISSYKQTMARSIVRYNSFEDALEFEVKHRLEAQANESTCRTLGAFIGAGLYGQQIKRYFEYFQKESFLILFYEDLASKPEETYRNITDFLGTGGFDYLDYTRHSNAAVLPRSRHLNNMIRGDTFSKRIFCTLTSRKLRTNIKDVVDRFNMRISNVSVDLSDLAVNVMRPYFNKDIELLSSLIDRDLSHWLR